MLILNRDEAEKIISHLTMLRFYYRNQTNLFKGIRAGRLFQNYLDELENIIREMEEELHGKTD